MKSLKQKEVADYEGVRRVGIVEISSCCWFLGKLAKFKPKLGTSKSIFSSSSDHATCKIKKSLHSIQVTILLFGMIFPINLV